MLYFTTITFGRVSVPWRHVVCTKITQIHNINAQVEYYKYLYLYDLSLSVRVFRNDTDVYYDSAFFKH